MNFEPYIERIENYLEGNLSESERTAFEKELARNEELRRALDLYRLGDEVIELGVEKSLRSKLQQWAASDAAERTVAPRQSARIVPMRRTFARLAVAVSVILLAGFFTWLWIGGQYSDEALWQANYEMPAPATFREGAGEGHPLEPGFKAIEKGDYQLAEAFFQIITPENERYAEAQYYLGHAAMQQRHFDTAIQAFGRAAKGDDPRFKEKAEWNLVLAYLAAHRPDADFQSLLNEIAEDREHSFHQEAVKLDRQLESFWRKLAE